MHHFKLGNGAHFSDVMGLSLIGCYFSIHTYTDHVCRYIIWLLRFSLHAWFKLSNAIEKQHCFQISLFKYFRSDRMLFPSVSISVSLPNKVTESCITKWSMVELVVIS